MPWAAVGAGVGAIAGALNNRKRTATSKSSSKFDETRSESGQQRRYLSPEQEQLLPWMYDQSIGMVENPGQYLNPLREFAQNEVNAQFAGAPDAIAAKYKTKNSGKAGAAARSLELARYGQLSGVDREFAKMFIGERDKGLQMAGGLMNLNLGQDYSSTATRSGSQTSEGTQTTPGNMAGGALGGGFGGFMSGMRMDKQQGSWPWG